MGMDLDHDLWFLKPVPTPAWFLYRFTTPVQCKASLALHWLGNPDCPLGIARMIGWLLGFYDSTRHKTIRLSEWVTPGDTAIPGMTSLKDGDLQHSSALAQSLKEI